MISLKKILALFLTTLILSGCFNKSHKEASEIFDDPQVIELALAAKSGDTETIDQLIAEGVDIDTIGKKNLTPLSWLFLMNKETKQKKRGFSRLIQHGANTLIPDEETGRPIFHLSAQYDDSEYLKSILKGQPDIDINHKAGDSSFNTPLLKSIFSHRYDNFEILIEHGANIEKKDVFGNTPITKASQNGTWQFAYRLLQEGADFNIDIKDGKSEIVRSLEKLRYTPSIAIERDGVDYREKVIEFLREKGVEVNPWYPEEISPKKNTNHFYMYE